MKIPPWSVISCRECGQEYQATRTEAKEESDLGVCAECESYDKGYQAGYEAGKEELEKEDEFNTFAALMRCRAVSLPKYNQDKIKTFLKRLCEVMQQKEGKTRRRHNPFQEGVVDFALFCLDTAKKETDSCRSEVKRWEARVRILEGRGIE